MKFLILALVICCSVFLVVTEDEIFEDTYNFDEPEEPEVIEEPKVVDVKQVDETRNPLPDNHENIPSLAGDKPCTIEFAINLFRPLFIEKDLPIDSPEFQIMCQCLVKNNCYAIGTFSQCVTGLSLDEMKSQISNFPNSPKDEL